MNYDLKLSKFEDAVVRIFCAQKNSEKKFVFPYRSTNQKLMRQS